MPDCWIFLLKRRRALSNVSFSPTRTSANPGFTSSGTHLVCRSRLVAHRPGCQLPRSALKPPECGTRPREGQTCATASGGFGIGGRGSANGGRELLAPCPRPLDLAVSKRAVRGRHIELL